MHTPPFQLRSIFFEAFDCLKINAAIFLKGMLGLLALNVVSSASAITWAATRLDIPLPSPTALYIISLSGLVVSVPILAGIINTAYQSAKEHKMKGKDFFCTTESMLRILLGTIFYAFIFLGWTTFLGWGGLILPSNTPTAVVVGILSAWMLLGAWCALLFSQFPYIVLDKKANMVEAFRKSLVITRGTRSKVATFLFLVTCINTLGIKTAMIGLFFTVPLSLTAGALIYLSLINAYEHPPRN